MGNKDNIKKLSDLFKKKYQIEPSVVIRLKGAGSGREYYRMESGEFRCIGVVGENLRDCRAFLGLTEVFRREKVSVPEIYGMSDGGLYYIEEDLGDCSLLDEIKKDRTTFLVEESLRQLALLQTVDEAKWEKYVEYSPFSKRQVMWDLNYFKYEYVRPSGIDFDEERLEDDFERLCDDLLKESQAAEGFMYRDFQSRNVMIKDGKCFFIDYQGGRRGPMIYDAVSFLWQAKAGFSKEYREMAIKKYVEYVSEHRKVDKKRLLDSVGLFALFRTLQVLGAYGLRGLMERKAHFIESIPGALANLDELTSYGVVEDYPELKRLILQLVVDPRFTKKNDSGMLNVEVVSFSYKKGYPANFTGNGGGFMFDCRGMHNPGRYKEYKQLTGLDEEVISFLKEKGEADGFAEKAFALISPTVERYIKRGFSNLQIGFGCTGGQHRSVYCAEYVSRRLSEEFPEILISVEHREQGIKKEIKKNQDQ